MYSPFGLLGRRSSSPSPAKLCLDSEQDTYAYNADQSGLSTADPWKTFEMFIYNEQAINNALLFKVWQNQSPWLGRIRVKISGSQYQCDYKEENGNVEAIYTGSGTVNTGGWEHFIFRYLTSATRFEVWLGDLSGGAITFPGGYNMINSKNRVNGSCNGFEQLQVGTIDTGLYIATDASGAEPDTRMADIRIWEDERTDAELTAGNSDFVDPASAGLLHYWRLNDVNGSSNAIDQIVPASPPYTQGVNGYVGFNDSPFP